MGEGCNLVCERTCRDISICRGAGSDARGPVESCAYEIGFAFASSTLKAGVYTAFIMMHRFDLGR
jgi:hypothetical protein